MRDEGREEYLETMEWKKRKSRLKGGKNIITIIIIIIIL
jgi:hypothetical protein